ncbi:unnamed protein product [Lota lota]
MRLQQAMAHIPIKRSRNRVPLKGARLIGGTATACLNPAWHRGHSAPQPSHCLSPASIMSSAQRYNP